MIKLLTFQFRTDQSLEHERECFRNVYDGDVEIQFINMLDENTPSIPDIYNYDAVVIAGSGQYNVTDWNEFVRSRAETLYSAIKQCVKEDFPLLGICFGHQLMAIALGGSVERDPSQAEGGTIEIHSNESGKIDTLFKEIPENYYVVAGHKDSVVELPEDAVLLASSDVTIVESYKIKNNIYAVQFHPELNLDSLLFRFSLYPEYTKGKSIEEIRKEYKEIPYAAKILQNFVARTK